MKRLCRKLAVAAVVLVWLGALVYLLVLSRRKLPELLLVAGGGGGAGGGGRGGESAAHHQVKTLNILFISAIYLALHRCTTKYK